MLESSSLELNTTQINKKSLKPIQPEDHFAERLNALLPSILTFPPAGNLHRAPTRNKFWWHILTQEKFQAPQSALPPLVFECYCDKAFQFRTGFNPVCVLKLLNCFSIMVSQYFLVSCQNAA